MVAFPGCKINLGLYVTGRRPDGYHNLETCFYPVGWSDAVEVVPSDVFSLHLPGSDLPADENNTCTKAFRLMQQRHGIPAVEAWLLKSVPHGAGLGGGSADGAAMLKILNDQFQVGLDQTTLEAYALELGSDCPFFIMPSPRLATGKGELFSPVNLSLAGYGIRIIKPAASISTAEAYRHVIITSAQPPLREILEKHSPAEWKNQVFNAFEPYALQVIPQLTVLQKLLYDQGALFAGMTGSGSAMFGIFTTQPERTSVPDGCVQWVGVLS